MIKVGTKKDVNRLRDMAMQIPEAVLRTNKDNTVVVEIAGKTFFSALKFRAGWQIMCKNVAVGDTVYGWNDPSELQEV